jgi:hypothetical protein
MASLVLLIFLFIVRLKLAIETPVYIIHRDISPDQLVQVVRPAQGGPVFIPTRMSSSDSITLMVSSH